MALKLLRHSMLYSRVDDNDDLITVNEQDRTLWDQQQIREGCELLIQTLQVQRCSEAFEFYAEVLAGDIVKMMPGHKSPMTDEIRDEFADKIMHISSS